MNETGEPIVTDWWVELHDEVLHCLEGCGMSAAELGDKLGVSEPSAASLVTMLAVEGKVRLARVERAA